MSWLGIQAVDDIYKQLSDWNTFSRKYDNPAFTEVYHRIYGSVKAG